MTAETKPESYVLVRWLFLRGLGFIHLMAFGSYAFQIIGLNGKNGILPTKEMLQSVAVQCGIERYWLLPTVAWLNCSDVALQGITLAGSALSILVILGVATAPALATLAVLWLSLVTGGGEFTGFQSDGMLVEVTVLSLFVAPWNWFEPPWPVRLAWRKQTPPSLLALWLLRFLLFRIMFASGMVKILSGDPTWRNLTAMQFHYETQPIPTPLAWYAHHLPAWIHKASAAFMYISELGAPLLMFTGRNLRLLSGFLMFALHLGIALTGNYTFLNFLLMLLCLTVLDDRAVKCAMPKRIVQSIEESQIAASTGRVSVICFRLAVCALMLIAGGRLATSIGLGGLVLPPVDAALECLAPLRIVDGYGLFAVMTRSRPEIVFQGSRDGSTWVSYEFKYKPGDDLTRPPPWVAPHMPRLDWRLWFAGMEPVEANPWVLNLVKRLLEGSTDIQIFFVKNPFRESPPTYVRAFVYDYHFTDAAAREATGCWWQRDNQRIYLPPVSLKDGKLQMRD
jgi:hypothetical protein